MKIEKVEKLVANLHDKTEYVIRIRNLKQALNHGLVLKKVPKVIKFNQNAWLKPYIDMNTDLRKKAKNYFEKYAVFGKTVENVTKHRQKKELFRIRTKLSYHKGFHGKYISNRNEKKQKKQRHCLFRTFNTGIKLNINV